jgi:DNA-binding phage protein
LEANELAERSAAYLQHMFSCNVAEVLREDASTLAYVARSANLNAGNLNHAMRGRHALTLATMIGVVVAMDRVDLFPAPSSLGEVQPD